MNCLSSEIEGGTVSTPASNSRTRRVEEHPWTGVLPSCGFRISFGSRISDFGWRAPMSFVFVGCLAALLSGCTAPRNIRNPASSAERRAVRFLEREVPVWYRQNQCFSCHNNGDAARALFAARRAGHPISPAALADTLRWLSQPQHWDENKGDPGFSDSRLATVQFANALHSALPAGNRVEDRRALRSAAERLVREQIEDGSWPVEPANAIGSPVTYGTALATSFSMGVLESEGSTEFMEAIRKAANWLRRQRLESVPTTAAIIFRPTLDDAPRRREAFRWLLQSQNADGGWGAYPLDPSEPFDTALALMALSMVNRGREATGAITRGREFLVRQQLEDGSWPASTRPPGGVSYAQQMSTTAWAVLALIQTRDGESR